MAPVGADPGIAAIADDAARASAVWARSVAPAEERSTEPLFGPVAGAAFHDGVETIYEGFLVHHAPRGRVFAPGVPEDGLLLGDYLYAAGLVRICEAGDVEAIAALADLVALAAHARAAGLRVDGELWAVTARHLGGERDGALEAARAALRAGDDAPLRALAADPEAAALAAAHRRLMGDA